MTQRVKFPCKGKETFLCRHARTGLRSRSMVGAIPCGRPLMGLWSPSDGLVVALCRAYVLILQEFALCYFDTVR